MKAGAVVAIVVGGLAVGGVVLYVLSKGGGSGSGSVPKPKGSPTGIHSVGDLIAAFGGSALSTLGKDLADWTAKEVGGLFGGSKPGGTPIAPEGGAVPPPSETVFV
jgi:hypothetical protein